MSGCMLVINPSSGREQAKRLEPKVIQMLSKHFGTVQTKYTEKAGDAKSFVAEAAKQRLQIYFVLGGDGTVNEAINGLAQLEHPLDFGFLPLGTVNDLARALKIPRQADMAINKLNTFKWQPLDIGKINSHYFANVVALGAIPSAVNQTSSEDKSRYGFFAYVRDSINAGIRRQPLDYKVIVDGKDLPIIRTEVLLVALTNSVGSFENMVKGARVDDGYLHFLALKDSNKFESGHDILHGIINGDISQANNVVYRAGKHIEIQLATADKHVRTNVDGDTGPHLPITLDVLPSKIKVMVPKA